MSFIQEDGGLYTVSRPVSEKEIIRKAQALLRTRMLQSEVLSSPNATRSYLQMKLTPYDREVFAVVYMTSQHQVIRYEELFQGTIDGAAIYPRIVVKKALELNASAIIMAHNHPSGVAEPSSADRRITERITSALGLVDVRVLDHIICTVDASYSFAENGLI